MFKLISLSMLAVVLLLRSSSEAIQDADGHSQLQQNDDVCKTFFEWVSRKDCSSDCSQKQKALKQIRFYNAATLLGKMFESRYTLISAILDMGRNAGIGMQQDDLFDVKKRNNWKKKNASSTNAHQSANHDSGSQKEEKEKDVSKNQEADNDKNLSSDQIRKCVEEAMGIKESNEIKKERRIEQVSKDDSESREEYDDYSYSM